MNNSTNNNNQEIIYAQLSNLKPSGNLSNNNTNNRNTIYTEVDIKPASFSKKEEKDEKIYSKIDPNKKKEDRNKFLKKLEKEKKEIKVDLKNYKKEIENLNNKQEELHKAKKEGEYKGEILDDEKEKEIENKINTIVLNKNKAANNLAKKLIKKYSLLNDSHKDKLFFLAVREKLGEFEEFIEKIFDSKIHSLDSNFKGSLDSNFKDSFNQNLEAQNEEIRKMSSEEKKKLYLNYKNEENPRLGSEKLKEENPRLDSEKLKEHYKKLEKCCEKLIKKNPNNSKPNQSSSKKPNFYTKSMNSLINYFKSDKKEIKKSRSTSIS